jgi:AhpD family alkylhydroperoxidase
VADIGKGWQALLAENPEVGQALQGLIGALAAQPALSEKMKHLIYIALQTANRNNTAVAAHIPMARRAGASRAEIAEAILLSIPAAGVGGAMACLPEVQKAFESDRE